MARRASDALSREWALGGRPLGLPTLSTEERRDGGLLVTVMLAPRGWRRWLGGRGSIRRSFGLDRCGRQVYEACDGQRTIAAIVERFGAANRVSPAEAEMVVTAFLKTLMAKGLVAMEVDLAEGRS